MRDEGGGDQHQGAEDEQHQPVVETIHGFLHPPGNGEQQSGAGDCLPQGQPPHGQHDHVPQEAVEVILQCSLE